MSDIKLFRFSEAGATELKGKSAKLEQNLHELIERHMECFLGIHFLAGEFPTGKNHHGRIDSLGLDENHCPVILEYKRHNNQNVINQGLFYLDWLLDHHGDFKLLVQERLGTQAAKNIEWDGDGEEPIAWFRSGCGRKRRLRANAIRPMGMLTAKSQCHEATDSMAAAMDGPATEDTATTVAFMPMPRPNMRRG